MSPTPLRLPRLLPLLLLAGCGGGFFVGIGDRIDNLDPSVNLVASVTQAAVGAEVRFIAAASDESGIRDVTFFRVDAGGNTELARDSTSPYEVNVVVPNDERTTLRVFARARDDADNTADSATVEVTITR